MSDKVLLIEDDPLMHKMLAQEIRDLGFSLEQALDGQTGLDRALNEDFALVIIDGNLPKRNGFDVCRSLREQKKSQPIIMLTSRTEEIDRVLGLEFGADDYITKPFSIRELAARIKGLFRRVNDCQNQNTQRSSTGSERLDFGSLQIDPLRHTVIVRGKKVELTAIEYKLLLTLANNSGKLLSRDDLLEQVWNNNASNFESTITVTIARLRTKIEEHPNHPTIIVTVRGFGYRFQDPRE